MPTANCVPCARDVSVYMQHHSAVQPGAVLCRPFAEPPDLSSCIMCVARAEMWADRGPAHFFLVLVRSL